MISLQAKEPVYESSRRQQCLDAKRIHDLTKKLQNLHIEKLEKDQYIAMLNRELQERDRLIGILRRKVDIQAKNVNRETNRLSTSVQTKQEHKQSLTWKSVPSRPIICTVSQGSTPRQSGKKPVSPFLSFCSAHRNAIKARHPKMSAADVTRLLGQQWRALTPEQQNRFC